MIFTFRMEHGFARWQKRSQTRLNNPGTLGPPPAPKPRSHQTASSPRREPPPPPPPPLHDEDLCKVNLQRTAGGGVNGLLRPLRPTRREWRMSSWRRRRWRRRPKTAVPESTSPPSTTAAILALLGPLASCYSASKVLGMCRRCARRWGGRVGVIV